MNKEEKNRLCELNGYIGRGKVLDRWKEEEELDKWDNEQIEMKNIKRYLGEVKFKEYIELKRKLEQEEKEISKKRIVELETKSALIKKEEGSLIAEEEVKYMDTVCYLPKEERAEYLALRGIIKLGKE